MTSSEDNVFPRVDMFFPRNYELCPLLLSNPEGTREFQSVQNWISIVTEAICFFSEHDLDFSVAKGNIPFYGPELL